MRRPHGGNRKGSRDLSVRVKTARGRKASSTRWLKRQLNDPYVADARRAGYRSRSAWKLRQLDDRLKFLKPNSRILDLGAAPGGWAQVAVERGAKKDGLIAVDLLPMEPIPGVRVLQMDVTEPETIEAILQISGGKIDVILSDMAAPTTGHRQTDHVRTMALCETAVDIANILLIDGGVLVVKVFQGGTEKSILSNLKRSFEKVRHVKPAASRKESPETYLVAEGFREQRISLLK
ncbi:MAG: rRNA methyltransferase [Rhodospirillaceae bacterium]|nr:rRNA methyltransferase [Rhodospirillaceae bacterium]